jgi:NADH:ubiquinone oxidoreductase subunit F (NADH-binding)/NADH:ubiquinone oxidoreductase subunit E
MLIQELQRIQEEHSFLPEEELRALAARTDTPLYRIQELCSFFPHFHRQPPPLVQVHVCRDMSCQLRGSAKLLHDVETGLAETCRQQTSGPMPRACMLVEGVSCLGRCDRAPAVSINEKIYVQRPADELCRIAHSTLAEELRRERLEADLKRVGAGPDVPLAAAQIAPDRDQDLPIDGWPWRIDCYLGKPAYAAVEQYAKCIIAADKEGNPQREADERQRVLKALETAGLLGMGGAGGRTYKKWAEVREAVEKARLRDPDKEVAAYVVCNADESEPGTFKDRELMLRTPYLLVEAMILAGLLVEAKQGYIYVRHEYPEQIAILRETICAAEKATLLGNDVLGTGREFRLEVFVSPGGYICGEQTALIEALQDQRAEPRNRPPALQTNGLWDCPTLLNNVETFAWVPAILALDEGRWYAEQGARQGKRKFKGLRFFSVSGDVKRPGVYEVPCGITVRELIERCGGLNRGLKAVALSGPSGGFLPAKLPRSFVSDRLQALVKERNEAELELAEATREFEAVELDLRHVRQAIEQGSKRRGDQQRMAQCEAAHDVVRTRVEKLRLKVSSIGRGEKGVHNLLAELFPNDVATFDILDLALDKELSREVGYSLGAGIVIYGGDADVVAAAINCLEFFRNESCGKCVPCRVGSQKLVEIGTNLRDRRYDAANWKPTVELAEELAAVMREASICGLGQVASVPLSSLVAYFPDDVARYLKTRT